MDVIKEKKQKKSPLPDRKVTITLLAVIFLLLLVYLFSGDTHEVRADEILISQVKRGDIEITVDGFGILESEHHLLITSRTPATVKEILLKPGAQVNPDSEIVRLENPELEQELFAAQQTLEMAKADYNQLKASQERELLLERGQQEELQALYETAKLRQEAQEELVEQGIISQFDYTSGQLQEKQLFKRLGLIASRIEQLKHVHTQSIKVEQTRVDLAKSRLTVVEQNMERLIIRAGMHGVLQRLPVSLGQSLTIGQEIALIGSVDALRALIRVPQTQAQKVVIGQQAEVRIQRDDISGKVVRIDPIVEDNTVTVEVELLGELPSSARPQLNINGRIIAEQVADTFYIERPTNAQEQGTMYLHKVLDGGTKAVREEVTLGRVAGSIVEISSRVEEGARYIISGVPDAVRTKNTLQIK